MYGNERLSKGMTVLYESFSLSMSLSCRDHLIARTTSSTYMDYPDGELRITLIHTQSVWCWPVKAHSAIHKELKV